MEEPPAPSARPASYTERLGEAVGILSRHGLLLRLASASAGFILLVLAADRSGDIGRYGNRESADNARGTAAAGFAIASGLCFLAATRRYQ